MENIDLLQYVAMFAAIVKQNPQMLSMAKEQQQFPEIERLVVALIGNADSVSEALDAYEMYGGIIPDWKFVFASEKGPIPGLSVNRTFSDGSVVRGLFSKARVIVLDIETRNEMVANGNATFPIDYSIALDTQALSYLTPYLQGNVNKLPKDFHEIFSFISEDNVYVDPIPYMIENLPNVLVAKKAEKIRKKMKGYEVLRTIDVHHFRETGEIRSTITESERNKNVNDFLDQMINNASNPKLIGSLIYQHTLMYCLLLKMTTIQLRTPQKSSTSKLHEFVEFADNKLQTIFAREIIVAAEYFVKGQNLAFFYEIQKSTPDRLPKLIAKLKNMAWDFWHIRYIEGAVTYKGFKSCAAKLNARYFFPALLTCDKKFVEIIDLYPLKSYAYKEGKIQPFPFPEIDWIAKVAGPKEAEDELLNKYFSKTSLSRRETLREQYVSNIHTITQDLEAEFRTVAVNR